MGAPLFIMERKRGLGQTAEAVSSLTLLLSLYMVASVR